MAKIFTKRACTKGLRAAGFQKSDLQLTRVATTYSLNGKWEGPTISVADTTVWVDDRKGPFSFKPSFQGIANIAEGAKQACNAVVAKLIEQDFLVLRHGVVEEDSRVGPPPLKYGLIGVAHEQHPVGVLHRFESEESGGVGTYNIRLHDEFDGDMLNGQGVGLTVGTTESATLRVLLDGSDLPRPIAVGGRHAFRTSVSAGRGVFSLWFWPTMDRRLERRLIF